MLRRLPFAVLVALHVLALSVLIPAFLMRAVGQAGTSTSLDTSVSTRFAVLPMRSYVTNVQVSSLVTRIFERQLAEFGGVPVIPSQQVDQALRSLRISDPSSLPSKRLAQLGRQLGANILVTGSVNEFLLLDAKTQAVSITMRAINGQTGQTIWTTAPLGADVTSYCSPILLRHRGRRLIASCSSAHGFGVDAERGTLLWNVPLKNQHLVNVTTPVYGSGSIFFVTPYGEEGRRYRLPADGAGGAVQLDWTAPLDTVTGGAVLVDGTLFATGYRKSKWWLGIDWETGRTRSECKELSTGAAIYADGRLYCLDERGTVGLLKPAADRLQVVGRFRLFDRRARDAWAHPVLCAGRLYLRYHDTLWCYDVKRHEERTVR